MRRAHMTLVVVGVVWGWGCGGSDTAQDERDLSLAPAESVAALDDSPQQEAAAPVQRPAARAERPAPPPPPVLPEGTVLQLTANDTISSKTHHSGDAITATASADIAAPDGTVLIPAGAVFDGIIDSIAEAGRPGGEGTLVLSFNRVTFGGNSYAMEARSDSLGTEYRGQGVSAGDAAKVGVGAAAGAVAGRIIGGNRTGTVVGGVVGAAAGAGIAAATKDQDIVLPAGGVIRLALAAPMVLQPEGN
jgi:Glycine zipper